MVDNDRGFSWIARRGKRVRCRHLRQHGGNNQQWKERKTARKHNNVLRRLYRIGAREASYMSRANKRFVWRRAHSPVIDKCFCSDGRPSIVLMLLTSCSLLVVNAFVGINILLTFYWQL